MSGADHGGETASAGEFSAGWDGRERVQPLVWMDAELTGFVLWSHIYDQPLVQRSCSKISFGRNRFEISIYPFSCEASSSSFMGLSLIFFRTFFP